MQAVMVLGGSKYTKLFAGASDKLPLQAPLSLAVAESDAAQLACWQSQVLASQGLHER